MSDEEKEQVEETEEFREARDDDRARAKHAEEPKTAEEKTEAQLMIEAKQKKHEEEEAARMRELEEQRRIQRLKEEEELRQLKEKQAQRKKEREAEERKLEEQRIAAEEQRRHEEEQRRLEKEAEKLRKIEEAERKKAAAAAAMVGGRNFTIEKTSGENTIDKFMNISKAKTEMGLNTNELEALRRKTIHDRVQPLALEGLDAKSLKAKAEELWKKIIQLEAASYDLEERAKRQEYDLKELNERQRQINQKKYLAAGLNPEANTRYPPKVQIISKYERRTDRRTFTDRKVLYDGAKQEEPKEVVRPKAVKRDNWIKTKEEEKKRGSSHESEYQQQQSYSSHNNSHHQEEEIAEEEEEE